jgi:hypothetical protein
MAFRVSCNYGAKGSTGVGEMVLSFEGVSCMEVPSKAPVSMKQTMLQLINYNLRHSPTGNMFGDQIYKFTAQDLEVLDRFNKRTILTLGTDATQQILQAETPRLACLVSHNDVHMSRFISVLFLAMIRPGRKALYGFCRSIHRLLSSSFDLLDAMELRLYTRLTNISTRFSCTPCWPSHTLMIASSNRYHGRLARLSSSTTTTELPC